jgi:hypothetical protein
MSFPLWKSTSAVVSALAALLVFSSYAGAQVCGDADGNGTVTVADGVQALRAAADLSSTCDADCDVDGDGNVTVTDGVNILRLAAELPVTGNCTGGNLETQVESLLEQSLAGFGSMIKLGVSASAAGSEQPCDNPEGDVVFDSETGEITFFDCDIAGINHEGSFLFGDGFFEFDITFTDLSTGESESLAGQLSERPVGPNFVLTGFFDFESSFGAFSVQFDDLVVDPSFFFIDGSLEFSIDDATLPEVESIRISFLAADAAVVDVILFDQTAIPFDFNPITGELTPISN